MGHRGMKGRQEIAAVIFDMDGLMFDTERIIMQAWKQAGHEFGYDIPDPALHATRGLGIEGTEHLFETILGPGFPFYQVRALRVQYTQTIIATQGLPIKDGLFELLDLLDTHTLSKAVATGTERAQAEPLLNMAHVLHRFDVLVYGDEVQNGKPDPEIFWLAAKRLQVTPEQCVVLEDSASGIRAASQAKMMPIAIPDINRLPHDVETLAFKTCDSLVEAAVFLSQLLSLDCV